MITIQGFVIQPVDVILKQIRILGWNELEFMSAAIISPDSSNRCYVNMVFWLRLKDARQLTSSFKSDSI